MELCNVAVARGHFTLEIAWTMCPDRNISLYVSLFAIEFKKKCEPFFLPSRLERERSLILPDRYDFIVERSATNYEDENCVCVLSFARTENRPL